MTIEQKFLDLYGECIDQYGPNSAQVTKLRAIIAAHYPDHRDKVANPSLYSSSFVKAQNVVDSSPNTLKAVDMSTLFADQKKSGLTNITQSVAEVLSKNEAPLITNESDIAGEAEGGAQEVALSELADLEVPDLIERLKRSGMESLSVKLGFNISKKKNNTEFATLLKQKLSDAK